MIKEIKKEQKELNKIDKKLNKKYGKIVNKAETDVLIYGQKNVS